MSNYGVYVGRFQPFHNGHLKQVEYALTKVESLLIVIGSAQHGRTLNNPFFAEERKEMIINSLTDAQIQRVTINTINDYKTDKLWQYDLNRQVLTWLTYNQNYQGIYIFGDSNDESSYYLKSFPYWNVLDKSNEVGYHGVDVRKLYFGEYSRSLELSRMVPNGTWKFLTEFLETEDYKQIKREW